MSQMSHMAITDEHQLAICQFLGRLFPKAARCWEEKLRRPAARHSLAGRSRDPIAGTSRQRARWIGEA